MEIESRLPDVGTTIFTVMSKMAADYGAINLSQGFPDFPVDSKLIGLISRSMEEGNNQYAPMAGLLDLRKSIAEMISRCYECAVDPESEVTITAGATQAIFSGIAALVRPGDEVIMFDPCYDSYDPGVRMCGGTPVHLPMRYPSFTIDWDEVRAKITSKTRMIIVNTPNNPMGTVLSQEDLFELESIVLKHGLFVVSDEVYEKLVYDGVRHESVLRYPGLASRSIACYSFGKTFHATGWKVGYMVAPRALTTEIRKAHQFIVFSVNTPLQHALATYLRDPSTYEDLPEFYQQKRDFFLRQLEGSSFEPLKTTGSYFQVLSYKNISLRPDHEMAEYLTRELKVASIPVSAFFKESPNHHLLRFCFAKKEETLQNACEILRKL